MVAVLSPRVLLAQPEYHMYGIRNGSSLIELDTTTFEPTFVSELSIPGMQGLTYDPVNERLLTLSSNALVYSVDVPSGALTLVADFQEFYNGSNEPYVGLSFDQGVAPMRLYLLGNFFPTRLLSAPQDGPFFQAPMSFLFDQNEIRYAAVSTRPGDGLMFLLSTTDNALQIVDKQSGALIQLLAPINPNPVEDIAFHPLTGVLYGVSSNRLFEIDSVSGAGNVLRTYMGGELNPTDALAFVPIPPTPTPTPTATATATATSTATATPCPESLGQCVCGEMPLVLVDGAQVCAPVNTLTKRTIPDAPQVTVNGRRVTLYLEGFEAVTDDRILDILDGIQSQASMSKLVLAAKRRKKLSIRYETQIKRRGSRTLDNSLRITRRNKVTLRNVPAGRYTARYRVRIQRGDKVVGKSRLSPRTGFKVLGGIPRNRSVD